jgi:hypothetical protein
VSSKLKGNSGAQPQANSTQPETGGFRYRARRVQRRSDVALTKSISNAANNQAMTRTIGSRRNKNSNAVCLAALRRVKKEIRDICV